MLAHVCPVHSCALLFLRQPADWHRGGTRAWEEGKLGWVRVLTLTHCVPLHGTGPLCLRFLIYIVKGRTARPEVPSS